MKWKTPKLIILSDWEAHGLVVMGLEILSEDAWMG